MQQNLSKTFDQKIIILPKLNQVGKLLILALDVKNWFSLTLTIVLNLLIIFLNISSSFFDICVINRTIRPLFKSGTLNVVLNSWFSSMIPDQGNKWRILNGGKEQICYVFKNIKGTNVKKYLNIGKFLRHLDLASEYYQRNMKISIVTKYNFLRLKKHLFGRGRLVLIILTTHLLRF